MVSYTRAKSESLGFTAGSGMANIGVAPREVRIVILTIGLILVGLEGGIFEPFLYLKGVELPFGIYFDEIKAARTGDQPRADRGPRRHHHRQRIVVVRHQSIEHESAKEIR